MSSGDMLSAAYLRESWQLLVFQPYCSSHAAGSKQSIWYQSPEAHAYFTAANIDNHRLEAQLIGDLQM